MCVRTCVLSGLAFPDLYRKCREAFLVNSDLTLRSQLTEFKDHKLLKFRKVPAKSFSISITVTARASACIVNAISAACMKTLVCDVFQGIDGAEYVVAPLDQATLKEFLTQQDEES